MAQVIPNESFWLERWQQGRTKWDLAGKHPNLQILIQMALEMKLLQTGMSIWSPGAGRGHDGAWLADMGFKVRVSDIIEQAVKEAKDLYGQQQNLTICQEDALLPQIEPCSLDAVFDRAFICAMGEEDREQFIKVCDQLLKPGGIIMTLPFLDTTVPGPPFGIEREELISLFSEFRLVAYEEYNGSEIYPLEKETPIVKEALMIFVKSK